MTMHTNTNVSKFIKDLLFQVNFLLEVDQKQWSGSSQWLLGELKTDYIQCSKDWKKSAKVILYGQTFSDIIFSFSFKKMTCFDN